MADRPSSSENGDDRDIDYNRESATGIPRWVKVVGIVVAVVALLVVVIMLVGGVGGHGPGRHGG